MDVKSIAIAVGCVGLFFVFESRARGQERFKCFGAESITVQLDFGNSSGSGVVIYSDEERSIVATARHVTENDVGSTFLPSIFGTGQWVKTKALVETGKCNRYRLGRVDATYAARVAWRSETKDVAIVVVENAQPFVRPRIRDEVSALDEERYLVFAGFPHRDGFEIGTGRETGRGRGSNGPESGQSGGPVALNGHLVGVVSAIQGPLTTGDLIYVPFDAEFMAALADVIKY